MSLSRFGTEYYEWAKKEKEKFNQLDAAQGDGDLGNTVLSGAKALKEETEKAADIPDWFIEGGKAFRKAAPSTMGILLASGMIKAGKLLKENKTGKLTMADWVLVQRIIIEDIQKRGNASLGDKTILDALIPAADTFEAYAEKGLITALEEASLSAKEAAENTKELDAKTGRSSWMGDRAKGNIDGGAWFCYKTYHFLLEWVKS